MEFRELKFSDLNKIDRIYRTHHQSSFGLQGRSNTVSDGVISHKDQVLAYGMIKLFSELIMVMDLDNSTKIKVKTLIKLIEKAINESKDAGLDQLHCFVENPEFANILRKHFGFIDVPGEPLVLNL